MGFGENLRSRRLSMGWTQQQLADRMGKTKNNISQYELGKREPNCEQLLSFARILGMSTDRLLGHTAEPALREAARAPYESKAVLAPLYADAQLKNPIDYKYAPDDLPDPQALFYYRAPDDSMTDYRIEQGDLLLLRRCIAPADNALHLLRTGRGGATLRMLRVDPSGKLLLMASARHAPEWVDPGAVALLGRLLRVEFTV